jgi:hypothetical protein
VAGTGHRGTEPLAHGQLSLEVGLPGAGWVRFAQPFPQAGAGDVAGADLVKPIALMRNLAGAREWGGSGSAHEPIFGPPAGILSKRAVFWLVRSARVPP